MVETTVHGIGALHITENDFISSAVEIHKPIALEVSMLGGRTIPIRPLNLSSAGPLEFTIAPTGGSYIQLSATRLYLKLKIQTAAGADIGAAAKIALINNAGNSLFKSTDIDINGRTIPGLTNTEYNYKSYLENLLSYSSPAVNSHMIANGWILDAAGDFGPTDTNTGFVKRQKWTYGSRLKEFMCPVASDLFNTDRVLPPGIKLTLRFTRASDDFCLIAPTAVATIGHKIVIQEAKLYVRYIDLNNAIVKRHQALILKHNAILPINRVTVKKFAFATGLSQAYIPNAYTGTLPKSLILGMISQTALNGSVETNPYNFQPFGVNYVSIRINGEEVPAEPYRPKFSDSLVIREYRGLFDNIGIAHNDLGNDVSLKHFESGCTLCAFDLSPDKCNGFHCHPRLTGNIDINLQFEDAFAAAVYVVIMATYDAYATIDQYGTADVNLSI